MFRGSFIVRFIFQDLLLFWTVFLTKYIYTTTTEFVPSYELGPPPTRKRVCPPPSNQAGGTHSPAGVGVGLCPNSDDWRKSQALCLLCDFPSKRHPITGSACWSDPLLWWLLIGKYRNYNNILIPDLDFYIPDPGSKVTGSRIRIRNKEFKYFYQCCGSGSTGSTCFWASRIRIH